ncbi:hypothetical protein Hanom_Chr12g01071671 [Helianthus anomalus]
MQIFTTKVITRTLKAMTFVKSSLLLMVAKEGRKLAVIVHIKAMLPIFATWSTAPGIEPLRSTGNFIATVIPARVTALRGKYLTGNHSFLLRKPCIKSNPVAMMQHRDAKMM